MKKILYFTLATLFALTACNSAEGLLQPEEPQSQPERHLVLKLDINSIGDEATKSVKREWEDGDEIMLVFNKETTNDCKRATLTYNASAGEWESWFSSTLEEDILATTSGTLSAVYAPFVKGTSTAKDDNGYHFIFMDSGFPIPLTDEFIAGHTVYAYHMVAEGVPYTVKENTLCAVLNMAVPSTANYAHFFLSNVNGDARRYIITVDSGYVSGTTVTGYDKTNDKFLTMDDGLGRLYGYPYDGGFSFSGAISSAALNTSKDYSLTLIDNKCTDDPLDDVTYKLNVSGKTLHRGSNVILPALDSGRWTVETASGATWSVIGAFNGWEADVDMTKQNDGTWKSSVINLTTDGFKIRYNHSWDENRGGDLVSLGTPFTVVQDGPNIIVPSDGSYVVVYNPDNETITVTAGEQMDYVPMFINNAGENICFATRNLGATAETGAGSYGKLYYWGGTVGHDMSEVGTTYYFQTSNAPYYAGYDSKAKYSKYVPTDCPDNWGGSGEPDNKSILDPEDDAATQALGEGWRLPDISEWRTLLSAATWEWDENAKAWKVYGLEPYSGNFIWLPLAGWNNGSSITKIDEEGNYMSRNIGAYQGDCDWFSILSLKTGSEDNNKYSGGVRRDNGVPVRAVYVIPAS